VVVLTAKIDQVDKPLVEAMVAHLRRITGDATLTLERIDPGSVKLRLEGTQAGFDWIELLHKTGQLTELLGFQIQAVLPGTGQAANRYYEKDGNLDFLNGLAVAIIGYGSQGHAHALNLRDSGVDVVVGLYPGSKSWAKAEAAGLEVKATADAAKEADVVMVLVSDHIQADLYHEEIAPQMTAGKTLMFAHGFNIHFQQIAPPTDVDVSMIAPKAPGHRLRELYTEGVGVPALVAVYQNPSGQALKRALAYALALGCLKVGVIETTFREETESGLFGEQSVLCGGLSELIRGGFETLVAAGYAPEIAYFECLHDLKLIVDLIQEGGLGYMRYSVSDTAEYGDYTRGPRIVDERTRAEMKKILSEIQSGEFARQWINENKTGRKNFLAMREAARIQPIERVGRELRAMMTFLKSRKRLPEEEPINAPLKK